jgi:hypothetical protein
MRDVDDSRIGYDDAEKYQRRHRHQKGLFHRICEFNLGNPFPPQTLSGKFEQAKLGR